MGSGCVLGSVDLPVAVHPTRSAVLVSCHTLSRGWRPPAQIRKPLYLETVWVPPLPAGGDVGRASPVSLTNTVCTADMPRTQRVSGSGCQLGPGPVRRRSRIWAKLAAGAHCLPEPPDAHMPQLTTSSRDHPVLTNRQTDGYHGGYRNVSCCFYGSPRSLCSSEVGGSIALRSTIAKPGQRSVGPASSSLRFSYRRRPRLHPSLRHMTVGDSGPPEPQRHQLGLSSRDSYPNSGPDEAP